MIQRVGVNTRVQRQNTSNNKPQNFGMSIPKEQVAEAVVRRDEITLNGLLRKIKYGHYHKSSQEVDENSKFLTDKLEISKQSQDKNGIIAWGTIKSVFDNTSAKLGFS